MNRLFRVGHELGMVIAMFGFTMLLPLVVAWVYGDAALHAYDDGALATIFVGVALWSATRGRQRELQVRDGFLLVVLTWTVLPALATIPLLIYLPDLSFTDAYFETVSGLTTTGATVLSALDSLPPSINVWRGELIWLGGMGLLVLAVAVLPLLGIGGRQIYKAETPGPMKDSKLTPRIKETAKGLWLVYLGITGACLVSYKVAGMSWLDALVHSFSTMGLGAFSSHDASYGYFHSPSIEAVAITFMLIAGMNFATHFTAWRSRSLVPYRRDPEALLFILITLASCLGIALYLWLQGTYAEPGAALRFAAFNTVSIATTTGFANADFGRWPIFAPLWMLFLSSFVSCSGSTGGGIKMIRAVLLYKQVFQEMTRTVHPRVVASVKLAGQPVPNNVIFAVLAFMFLYTALVVSMTLILTASGMDAISAFSAVVACINNTGPGLGQVGPGRTYASLSDFQTWICILAMLLGRLELFTLLVVLTPNFWRK